MNKQAHYWQMQEDRWHDQYLVAEKTIDELEMKAWSQSNRIEKLEAALRDLSNGWECCTVSIAMRTIARKALEGKDE